MAEQGVVSNEASHSAVSGPLRMTMTRRHEPTDAAALGRYMRPIGGVHLRAKIEPEGLDQAQQALSLTVRRCMDAPVSNLRMLSGGVGVRFRRVVQLNNDRATLVCCFATLLTGAASFLLHFSPGYIAIPMVAAVVCAMRSPFRALIEMFFGGRR